MIIYTLHAVHTRGRRNPTRQATSSPHSRTCLESLAIPEQEPVLLLQDVQTRITSLLTYSRRCVDLLYNRH